MPNPSDERFGIALRIVSGLLFALMTGCVKALGDAVPLGQIVFFRSAFALIPLIVFLWWTGDFPGGLKTSHPWAHVVRCFLGIGSLIAFFATIRLIRIAEATTLLYLAPVLVVVLAAVLLGETVSNRRWTGVGLGMAGVLVLTVPNFSISAKVASLSGIGLGFLAALLMAGAMVQIRKLTKMGEKAGAIALYFALTGAAAGLTTLYFGWIMPDTTQLLFLVGAGLAGGFAHIFMTISYRYAEASAMAPFEYLSVLWAILLGTAFFNEVPSLFYVIAAPLIVAGAVVSTPRRKATAEQR